jgi:hypothetical protein
LDAASVKVESRFSSTATTNGLSNTAQSNSATVLNSSSYNSTRLSSTSHITTATPAPEPISRFRAYALASPTKVSATDIQMPRLAAGSPLRQRAAVPPPPPGPRRLLTVHDLEG